MRLPQLQLLAKVSPLGGTLLRRAALPLRPWQLAGNALVEGQRTAAVKAQGAYRLKNKTTLPKKLGAKRVGEQYVLPGTIIYKQRGTLWHAGENAILGRDHTIHSAIAGYVKYYRDPERHPDRQYIGVTYDRNDTLPYSPQAPRKRKLNMKAIPRKVKAPFELMTTSGIPRRVIRKEGVVELAPDLSADADVAAVEAAEAAANAVEDAADAAPEAEADAVVNRPKARKKPDTKASRAARRWNAYVRIKRTNRMLYLAKNYSYQESNFQIGRLMGKHKGKTPGTQRYGSRHKVLRYRRTKRDEQVRQTRELERQQKAMAADRGRQRGGSGGGSSGGKKAEGKKAEGKKAEGKKAKKAKKA